MTQRLATDYMKVILDMDKPALAEFISWFADQGFVNGVKFRGNGDCEVTLCDLKKALHLVFRKRNQSYQLEDTCRISDQRLSGMMRKALKRYQGCAIVHRIYSNFTMVYHYDKGIVTRISEMIGDHERVIYEYRNLASQLEAVYRSNEAVEEIDRLKVEADSLLDQRNQMADQPEALNKIDERLSEIAHRLFILEA
ncbi:MAG: non-ribosomal peptide synthetase module [Bacillaceae bacterium]|nr:non-ribosomal peptide synthetase module [Bacillaceae bacterium]